MGLKAKDKEKRKQAIAHEIPTPIQDDNIKTLIKATVKLQLLGPNQERPRLPWGTVSPGVDFMYNLNHNKRIETKGASQAFNQGDIALTIYPFDGEDIELQWLVPDESFRLVGPFVTSHESSRRHETAQSYAESTVDETQEDVGINATEMVPMKFEPAARKMVFDENYDDEEDEEMADYGEVIKGSVNVGQTTGDMDEPIGLDGIKMGDEVYEDEGMEITLAGLRAHGI